MKRVLSMLLVMALLISVLPTGMVLAEEPGTAYISVESVDAEPGSTVEVAVKIAENPGIASAGLTLELAEGLSLVGATNGKAFEKMTLTLPAALQKGESVTGSCRFAWLCSNNVSENGTILTLQIKVAEDATVNEDYSVTVTCEDGDILNSARQTVNVITTDGKISVIDYKPGDVDNNKTINMLDVLTLCQYYVDGCQYDPDGYGIAIREEAGDVDANGKINMLDVLTLCQYYVDGCKYDPLGYGVKLYPGKRACIHNLTAVAEKAVSCTVDGNNAYWYCDKCGKYYSNANATIEIAQEDTILKAPGHTVVIDEAVAPTAYTTGLTEGSHCSACKKTLVPQVVIPVTETAITYYISNNDSYLAAHEVINENLNEYDPATGLKLDKEVTGPEGYTFNGWYDGFGSNATQIKEIPAGSSGNKSLYAHWELTPYTIQYDCGQSPLIDYEDETYTVNTGKTLPTPDLGNYVFMGWSDAEGKVVTSIEKGTTGNITLYANWTSRRNLAKTKTNYDDPIIIEDSEDGQILFTYEIGTIENVPLVELASIEAASGLKVISSVTKEVTIDEETVKSAAESVAKATTNSSSWSLSSDWSDSTSVNKAYAEKKGWSEEEAIANTTTSSGTVSINSESGGTTTVTNSEGITAKTANSKKSETTYATTDENGAELSVSETIGLSAKEGVSATVSAEAKAKTPVAEASVSASATASVELEQSSDTTSGRTDTTKHSTTSSGTEGTSSTLEYSADVSNTQSQSKSWNVSESYSKSQSTSSSSEVSMALSSEISSETGYGSSYTIGGENHESQEIAQNDTQSKEYSNTVTFAETKKTVVTNTYETDGSRSGSYRLWLAGTLHVFAIVGYDVANSSYYTYTYSVMDEETHEFLDYSENSSFSDHENSVLTFEVPYYVEEYVNIATRKTNGIVIDAKTGIVEEYTGTSRVVCIPEYDSVDTGDGKIEPIKVKGISSTAFKGNTNVEVVMLNGFISEIPASAFEGCTSLKELVFFSSPEIKIEEETVAYISGGISIGANAFKGCASMNGFTVSTDVVSLGANAFEGVSNVTVNARNSDVADAALNSGAKSLSLKLDKMDGSFNDRSIVIGGEVEYFGFFGGGTFKNPKSYSNLTIRSDAGETVINGVDFVDNTSPVLKTSSPKVTLNRVSVEETPGLAMIFTAEETDISLFDTVSVNTIGENAVLSRNLSLKKENADYIGKMQLNGNLLICGDVISGEDKLTFNKGGIVKIDEDTFTDYLTSIDITFDANEGNVSEISRKVSYGCAYGDLPVPTREHYNFLGWYTEKDGGTLVTKDTVAGASDMTLYAHWQLQSFTLSFNANGGSVSETSRSVNYGYIYGSLPTPTRDYYTFAGWYTAPDGGTQVSANTTMGAGNTTVYAHWTLNGLSDWVLSSQVPAGAQILNTKYTYNLTSYTQANTPTLQGWQQYNSTSAWSDYGSWSSWQNDYVAASDSRAVETRYIDPVYETRYNYYRYVNASHTAFGTKGYADCYYYESISLNYQLDFKADYGVYAYGSYGTYCKDGWLQADPFETSVMVAEGYYQYRYCDRTLIYTYYFSKVDSLESATDPTGQANVSNVVQWVRYRAK